MASNRRNPSSTSLNRSSSGNRRAIMAVLLTILIIEIGIVLLTSPYFHIKTVIVTGNRTIPDARIVEAANIQPDTNIFRIMTKPIKESILANPVIEYVEIHRKIPSEIIIEVRERQTYSILDTGEKLYEIDRYNMPFRVIDKPSENLPIIMYAMKKKVLLGKEITDAVFIAAQRCIGLCGSESGLRISKVVVDRNDELCLNIHDGFIVKIGRPTDLDQKISIASQVIRQIPDFAKNGEYIDVTVPEVPAVKYKN